MRTCDRYPSRDLKTELEVDPQVNPARLPDQLDNTGDNLPGENGRRSQPLPPLPPGFKFLKLFIETPDPRAEATEDDERMRANELAKGK